MAIGNSSYIYKFQNQRRKYLLWIWIQKMNITSIQMSVWMQKTLNEMKMMKSWNLNIIKSSGHSTSSLIHAGEL